MNQELSIEIVLSKPTPAVVFGLQEGSGKYAHTIQNQLSTRDDLRFQFSVNVKAESKKQALPNFFGKFVQGPAGGRFIYIGIGTYAGQINSIWSRRLKVPLTGISSSDIESLTAESVLTTVIPGTGKDGGPNCATVKPFPGWQIRTLL